VSFLPHVTQAAKKLFLQTFVAACDTSGKEGLQDYRYLHYPNDLDRPLNEAAAEKIRQYRADYHNRPSNAISFMLAISSTSGRLHSEFVRLLFLQAHREI
jgi:hypothetical protein